MGPHSEPWQDKENFKPSDDAQHLRLLSIFHYVQSTEFTLTTPVTTTFTYTRDEYVLAMKRHYQSSLKVGRDVVGALLAISGGTYLLASTDFGWLAWLLLVAGAGLLAVVGYALFLLPRMIYRSQPKLRDQYSLTLSDDGIAFKTDSIDATLQWSFYHSWLSDDDFYFMYHGKRDVSVIPRRSLADGDDARLCELLTKNIGPPKA